MPEEADQQLIGELSARTFVKTSESAVRLSPDGTRRDRPRARETLMVQRDSCHSPSAATSRHDGFVVSSASPLLRALHLINRLAERRRRRMYACNL